jgi:hypothetical protein
MMLSNVPRAWHRSRPLGERHRPIRPWTTPSTGATITRQVPPATDEQKTDVKSIWNEHDRVGLLERLRKLKPDTLPRWGRMTAPAMVAHCIQTIRMADGTLPIVRSHLPFRYAPLKQLIVYMLPFPKNVPTAPELIARPAGEWTSDLRELATLLDELAAGDPFHRRWPAHPAFGNLSPRAWGVLGYKHLDHHLRQFGI